MGRPSLLIFAFSGYGIYLLLTSMISSWLGLTGRDLWIFRIGLWLLGAAVTGIIVWFAARSSKSKKAKGAITDDIDNAFDVARQRLSAARSGKTSLGKMPIAILLGPTGGSKTTTLVRSGIEPDLLAGEIYRGETVAPTSGVNLWYSHQTVYLETGGPILEDRGRWARVIQKLQPERMAAVLAGRTQASRIAIVCLSCEELTQARSSETIPILAQKLRERLAELSQALGVRLPVYVIFTKCDRLPGFHDYVRNFSNEEVRQVFGSTLRLPPAKLAAAYADREYQRLNDAFNRLFAGLAERRLDVLSRETEAEHVAGAYEFPREFRKTSGLATQFLVELCKPSQLQVSPFLRGFYFTGVRPIVIAEGGAAPQLAQAPSGMGATQAFNPAMQQMAQAPAVGRSRRVPQWVFLDRFLRDVILKDHVAWSVTQAGVRLTMMRRLALVSATALSVILLMGLLVSFIGNRRIEGRSVEASQALVGVVSTEPELPTFETLTRLDELRAEVERLHTYETEGVPLRLRWGLYRGDHVQPEVRRIYIERLETLMLGTTRQSLLHLLRNVPAEPTPQYEYGSTYNALKAYLMTTSHPEHRTSEFLAPILMEHWLAGRQIDEERRVLVRRQFDFYSGPLCANVPACAAPGEAPVVAHVRGYLLQFADAERIYQVMVSQASERNASIQFSRSNPGASTVLRNTYEVPGAFTEQGWAFVHEQLQNVDQYLAAENWVIGEQALLQQDRVQLVQQLQTDYRTDYVRHWRAFLEAAQVQRFGSVRDAAQKLNQLSAPQSPLLAMLAMASTHTAVDSQTIGEVFQPVQMIVPPGVTDRLIGEGNQDYMNGLLALQGAVEQVANASGDGGQAAAQQSLTQATGVRTTVRQIAQGFNIDGDARAVGGAIQELMQAPAQGVEALLRNYGPNQLNVAGRNFCRAIDPVLGKYPFTPSSSRGEATVDEVNRVFRPGASLLWSFHDEYLQNAIERQGDGYGIKASPAFPINPAFVEFFERAAGISEVLYGSGEDPRMILVFEGYTNNVVDRVTLNVDGTTFTYTPTSAQSRRFNWTATSAREASIRAHVGGQDAVHGFNGTWALFKLFFSTDDFRPDAGGYRVRWNLQAGGNFVPVEGQLFLTGPAILNRAYMAGLQCPSRLTR